MAVITLAADSTTLTLNGYIFTSFSAGDIFSLVPVNPLTSHVNSSDGGTTINARSDGRVYDLTVRVQRMSDDDIFLNSAVNGEGVTLLEGSAKENFVKNGIDGVETFTLSGGSVMTPTSAAKNDQDGNAVSEYVMRFRTAVRTL